MITENFIDSLEEIVNKKCWGFVAGEGTGSVVSLDFGQKFKRVRPLKNIKLSEDLRFYDAEYSFLINCSWRFDSQSKIICSSKDSNHKDGPMEKGLERILNKTIISVNVTPPAYDLTLKLSEGFSFKFFCDETSAFEVFDNYSYYTPTHVFTVANKSKIEVENRNII